MTKRIILSRWCSGERSWDPWEEVTQEWIRWSEYTPIFDWIKHRINNFTLDETVITTHHFGITREFKVLEKFEKRHKVIYTNPALALSQPSSNNQMEDFLLLRPVGTRVVSPEGSYWEHVYA